jgi:signal transduction histidine kinase
VAGAGVVIFTQAPMWEQNPLVAVLPGLVGVAFLLTGALTSQDPGQRGNARLLGLTGVAWILGGLSTRDLGPLPLLGWMCSPLFTVFGAVLVLRYPDRRLALRRERVFVGVTFGWLIASYAAIVATSEPNRWGYGYDADVWWPTIIDDARVGAGVEWVSFAGMACLAVVFVWLAAARVRRLRAVDRQAVPPVVVAGGAVGVAASIHVIVALLPQPPFLLETAILEALAMLAVPAAFLVAAVRRRLACGAVADLVLRVAQPDTPGAVQDGLRLALRDPDLEVWYWVPNLDSFADSQGRIRGPEEEDTRRLCRKVDASDGHPLATVLMDPSLERHTALVDAALTACGLSMENARLQAALQTQLEQVQASRARIVEAGLAERRRLERDLHDGAQQRLLALAMSLASVERRTSDPGTLAMLDQSRAELRRALQELRDLARGIHPALLTQAGLGPALEAVAEGLPLPVQVRAPARRWDPAVEATAYFVICEALANAVKHGAASRAQVRVEAAEGQLLVEVTDDGRGGAHPARSGGLSGLQDRLGALGGDLAIVSPRGAGTRIQARIPCA